jgi:hypothetical protein
VAGRRQEITAHLVLAVRPDAESPNGHAHAAEEADRVTDMPAA